MPTSSETPNADQPVALLDRLDALRKFLVEQREEVHHLSMAARSLRQIRIDEFLAAVDDACEALQHPVP